MEKYVEDLYEEEEGSHQALRQNSTKDTSQPMSKKQSKAFRKQLKSIRLILKLAEDRMEELSEHAMAMAALSRILSEKYKDAKNRPLTFEILKLFVLMSFFEEMHPILTDNRVGSTMLKIVQYEMERFDCWEEEWREQWYPDVVKLGEEWRRKEKEDKNKEKKKKKEMLL